MNSSPAYFNLAGRTLVMSGDWVIENAAAISKSFGRLDGETISIFDARQIQKMDSWGAFYLKTLTARAGGAVQTNEAQKKLLDFLPEKIEISIRPPKAILPIAAVEILGAKAARARQETVGILRFIGQAAIVFLKNFGRPKAFRIHSVIRHIDETGIRALPIIGLLAILTSMVISYQAATQLQKFGANIFTIDLTVISLLREMGVLITAIMVAGRSGSAFAAEIGVMKLREEVDALRTMGMEPFEVLVIPRIIALMITLPILTFAADIIGLCGGALISMVLLQIPLDQYIDRVQMVAKPEMFFVGMIKAPVFAFIIAIIGTYQGMNISGSAESVGKLTTVSVVQAIFLVIMADALFSVLFAQLGI